MAKQTGSGADSDSDEADNPFTDTDNPAVLELYKLGIVTGTGDGAFHPQDELTMQEKAVILYRTLKILNPVEDRSNEFNPLDNVTREDSHEISNDFADHHLDINGIITDDTLLLSKVSTGNKKQREYEIKKANCLRLNK